VKSHSLLAHQFGNLAVAFAGPRVSKKCRHLVRGWQRPGKVNADPTEKLGVGAQFRRLDPQLGQFRVDAAVDLRPPAPNPCDPLPGANHRDGGNSLVINRNHMGITRHSRCHPPFRVNRRDGIVVRPKTAQAGHILGRAISPFRDHSQGFRFTRLRKQQFPGNHAQAGQLSLPLHTRSSRLNPIQH